MSVSPDRKILITAPSWIGDMVMAQSLFKYLKTNHDISIDVLAPNWVLGLVERMPEIRRGIAFNSRHGKLDLAMRVKTGWSLREERYDEAIVMPRSLKAAIPSWLAGIPRRSGFSRNLGLINNPRKYRKVRTELFVRRFLALADDEAYSRPLADIPRPQLRVDAGNSLALLEQHGLTAGQFVVFAPGAEYGPAKQWPMKNFAELASKVSELGWRVLIVGSAKEQPLARDIITMSDSDDIVDLCGTTSIADVIDLASASAGMVVNDSGLMHLGGAAGARVLAIYGSSSALYTPPLSDSAMIFQTELDCRPCFQRRCPYGHYRCLESISPQQLFQGLSVNS